MTTSGSGRRGGWAVPGRAPRSRGRAWLRDRAGDGADQGAVGQDVGDRAVQPQGDALPGQRQPGADDVIAEADVARGVHGPLDLDHVAGCRGQRRRPGGLRTGGGEAGQVAGVQPGRQGLDPVPVQQDVDPVQAGPEPDGAAGHRGAEPDLLPGDPQVPRRRHHPVQLPPPALPAGAAGVRRARSGSPIRPAGSAGGSGGLRRPGELGRDPQAEDLAGGRRRTGRRGRPWPATGAAGRRCTPCARHPPRPARPRWSRTARGRSAVPAAGSGAAARSCPVVVGERGLVSRWVMPFSRQIRSNSTSAGRGLPNRPVNCLPLSDKHFAGTP